MKEDRVYLDYSSTTPCEQAVVDAMLPYFTTIFGNPNSLHQYGDVAAEALASARLDVAQLINAESDEIIFTSGATEANKIIIERVMKSCAKSKKNHFITFKAEHKSVLGCGAIVAEHGAEVSIIDVDKDGRINFETFRNALKENTGLVSVCFVNNETGVLQDIKQLATICHEKNIFLHTDATQALGKIAIDVRDLDIDFLSASSHKIYGPKGVGILFCRKKLRKILKVADANSAVEFGIREGTVPVALCVGMGKAASLIKNDIAKNLTYIAKLRDRLIHGLQSQLEEIVINGSHQNYPGIVNISFRGCEGEALMMEAQKIAVSSSSACTSSKLSASHVLAAMNVSHDIAQSSLRITIGKRTTEREIDIAIEELVFATNKLRAISPIWDMIKEGVDVAKAFEKL